jgi:hypothetical protein
VQPQRVHLIDGTIPLSARQSAAKYSYKTMNPEGGQERQQGQGGPQGSNQQDTAAQLAAALATTNEQLAAAQAVRADRYEQLAAARAELADRDEQLAAAIANRDEQLAAERAVTAAQHSVRAAQEAAIAALDAIIAIRDEQLAQQRAVIAAEREFYGSIHSGKYFHSLEEMWGNESVPVAPRENDPSFWNRERSVRLLNVHEIVPKEQGSNSATSVTGTNLTVSCTCNVSDYHRTLSEAIDHSDDFIVSNSVGSIVMDSSGSFVSDSSGSSQVGGQWVDIFGEKTFINIEAHLIPNAISPANSWCPFVLWIIPGSNAVELADPPPPPNWREKCINGVKREGSNARVSGVGVMHFRTNRICLREQIYFDQRGTHQSFWLLVQSLGTDWVAAVWWVLLRRGRCW